MIENFLRRPHGFVELLADGIRLVGALSVLAAFIWFEPTDGGIVALALPALLVPRFLGIRSGFDVLYGLVVLIAAWSNVIDLYRTVVGWDIVMHVVATAVLAAMTYLAFALFGVIPLPGTAAARPRTAFVLVPTIGLAISAIWEMIEWAGKTFITDEIFVTYQDTIGDMVAGGLGAAVAGVVVARVRLLRQDVRPAAGVNEPQSARS